MVESGPAPVEAHALVSAHADGPVAYADGPVALDAGPVAHADGPVALDAGPVRPQPEGRPGRETGRQPAREMGRQPGAAAPLAEQEPARERPSGPDGDPNRLTCSQAQLRRFIKSRPWVPMHELRRRFGIYGGDDDVSPMRVKDVTLFIGLPPAEARMLGELLGSGDVGCELSLDPEAPVVIGVYPMRPVPRS